MRPEQMAAAEAAYIEWLAVLIETRSSSQRLHDAEARLDSLLQMVREEVIYGRAKD